MIVKAQTFRRDGRYPTALARAAYLERDGRAVETGSLNINNEEGWAREMDRTSAQHSLRGAVVGREYVLSPSPDDLVTPVQMRGFAMEWAAANFPTAECAVVVHIDNKERIALGKPPIPHAHVYMNAVDLETGKKVVVSRPKARELHDSAQRMARERGWSTQEEYWDEAAKRVRHLESERSDLEKRPQWQRSARLRQEIKIQREAGHEGSAVSLEGRARSVEAFEASVAAKAGIGYREYEAAKAGIPLEKTAVRRAVKAAAADVAHRKAPTMKAALAARGIEIAQASGGDYKYRMKGSPRVFKGKSLGRGLSAQAIEASVFRARGLVASAADDAAGRRSDLSI